LSATCNGLKEGRFVRSDAFSPSWSLDVGVNCLRFSWVGFLENLDRLVIKRLAFARQQVRNAIGLGEQARSDSSVSGGIGTRFMAHRRSGDKF